MGKDLLSSNPCTISWGEAYWIVSNAIISIINIINIINIVSIVNVIRIV
ncbi:MAG: hypothetical protein J6R71_06990 [Bacteroidales bacterium]|nr:hypothetical protein [Bacteroidales bacterium]